MKFADLWAALGGAGAVSGIGAAWVTLRANSRKDSEARQEKERLRQAEIEGAVAADLRKLVDRYEAREIVLLGRVERLQATVDELRGEMRKGFDKREAIIDQLRGENRQLKQLAGHLSSNPNLRPDPPEGL